MTSDEAIREQVTRVWSGTLRGDEPPGRTVRPAPAASPGAPPASSHTVSILFPPGLECAPEAGLAAPAGAARGASRPEAEAGFQVLRTLGRGGMGVVYAARQGSLEREVALKMPLAEAGRGAAVEARFVSEALVTGDLDHPNIVPVHDLGRDEAGRLYMVMKLVRGTPWERLLHPRADQPEETARAAALALRDHLEVLLKVADAVAFAHARGIVHRDLKPENVMVGAFGEVLVMDWGLALDVSPAGRAARKAQHKSEAHGPAGTPSYMSPELARADYERIGVASDVYLLGAILYELLTGEPPHLGRDVFEVLAAAASGVVQPPELRAPGRVVPRELARIVLRALAADPAERYPDVPSLQRALHDYLAHEESLRLVEEARGLVERLARPGVVAREARYALYADALAAFAQALHLWPQNDEARSGRERAALDYADEALDRGDVGLARAQLALVEQGAAEPARVASLRAAVAARSVSRLRARLGAVGVAALLAAAAWGVKVAEEGLQARRHAEGREDALASHLRDAWSAAREGDLARLSAARVALGPLAAGAGPQPQELLARVDWARDVLLWQQGRWSELGEALAPAGVEWRTLAPSRGKPARPGALPQGQAEVCERLLARPEVAASTLAAGIADLCARGLAASPELFGLLREAARRGVDPAVLDAARHELLEVDAGVRAGLPQASAAAPSGRGASRFRLRVSALFTPNERLLVPFRLSEPPLGERQVPAGRAPRMVRRGDGCWAALDPGSGAEQWRTIPMESPDAGGTAVPVEDGSVVVAAGSQAVRFDGATGRVLGRAALDGRACLAWPDPTDRSRLVVLVSTQEWKGLAHEIRLQRGVLTPPVAEGGQVQGLFPTRSGAQAWRSSLRAQGEVELGKGAAGVSERVLSGLRAAIANDRGNPDLWLAALEETAPAASALREELARGAAAAEVAGPMDAVRLGVALERAGFRRLADRLYERAAQRFLDLHGNPDLVTPMGLTPADTLRRLGGELFASGDTARALELAELGRRFCTFLGDDARFYRRYAAWLRGQGLVTEAALIERRALAAHEAGSPLQVPGRVIAAADASIAVLPLAALLLGALLLRGCLASRAARHADLHARGWRRAGQRWSAFATQPVERLGYVFLAYMPRLERLAVVLLAAAVLASAAVLVGGLRAATAATAAPPGVTSGYLTSDDALRYLGEARRAQGRLASLRLLAEAHRGRGEAEAVREFTQAALHAAQDDPLALNNLGVLEEEAGRELEARTLYVRAGRLGGDGAAVARWNLARLDADARRPAALATEVAHRDRLRAGRPGAARPLWASCPTSDLHDVQAASDSLAQATAEAAIEILTARFGDLLGRTFMTAGVLG